jgi:hypothetical protein
MPVTIQVTQDDIDNGVRCSVKRCPVALACLRTIGKNYSQIWEEYWPDFHDPSKNIPSSVLIFVRAFDSGNIVQPFSFVLPDSVATSEAP